MNFDLNAKHVQIKQDRYHAQATYSRLVADLNPKESWVMAARRKLVALIIHIRSNQPVVTPPLLSDPYGLDEPATVVQTSQ
jgi:hypothetical protein